jgi:hypothetical protein
VKKWRRWLKTGSMDWWQSSMIQAYRNLSHDASAWIFIGIIWKIYIRSFHLFFYQQMVYSFCTAYIICKNITVIIHFLEFKMCRAQWLLFKWSLCCKKMSMGAWNGSSLPECGEMKLLERYCLPEVMDKTHDQFEVQNFQVYWT